MKEEADVIGDSSRCVRPDPRDSDSRITWHADLLSSVLDCTCLALENN